MKEFFAEIDETIQKQRDTERQKRARAISEADGFAVIAERLGPVLADYEAELKTRNVVVRTTVGSTALSMELKFKSGDTTTLMLIANPLSGRFSFETHHPADDKGKRYKSVDGSSFDTSTWSDAEFVRRLEGFIKDFFFYADRHQGF